MHQAEQEMSRPGWWLVVGGGVYLTSVTFSLCGGGASDVLTIQLTARVSPEWEPPPNYRRDLVRIGRRGADDGSHITASLVKKRLFFSLGEIGTGGQSRLSLVQVSLSAV